MSKLAVLGAGAWGTAIANLLANNGHEVIIWALEQQVVDDINNFNENKTYLANIQLSKNIKAVNDLSDIRDIKAIFSVVPAQYNAGVFSQLKKLAHIKNDTPIIICSKGIDNEKLKLLSDIVVEFFSNPICAMCGPNFADEIAQGLPAITTIASKNILQAKFVATLVKNKNFRPFICEDIIGAEIAGSIKNVIAIAMGIAVGMNLSESSKASILTKGLNEIGMLSKALGGKKRTAIEPCGVGDLVLTCSSQKSRNMSLGFAIGKGELLDDILKHRNTVAEGVATSKAAYNLGKKYNLNLEIINLIYEVLYNDKKITVSDFF